MAAARLIFAMIWDSPPMVSDTSQVGASSKASCSVVATVTVTGEVLALPEIELTGISPSRSSNHLEVSASVGMLTVQSRFGVKVTSHDVSPTWIVRF